MKFSTQLLCLVSLYTSDVEINASYTNILRYGVLEQKDYHNVTAIWVTHWCDRKNGMFFIYIFDLLCFHGFVYFRWDDSTLAWFRLRTCAPNTANTLCTVPINGGAYFPNETEWCEFHYQANNCTEIRNEAQSETTNRILFFYYLCALWGMIFVILVSIVRKANFLRCSL